MTAVELTRLRKEFTVPSGTEVAVDDIDLEIQESEFVTLVGPSGCGKTTTLRCIAGLETPTSGEIRFNGRDIVDVPANKRNISMMFQNIALYPHMTIRENIAYPLKVRAVPKGERNERAKEAAELMQVGDLLEKYPAELSGGQRQRAALARTWMQDPQLFLMDEPLSDLDAKLKVEIRKEIQRLHKKINRSTVYVTHDQEEAMTMSDRIVVMNGGKIEQVGTPDELYGSPANTFIAEFIGNPSMNFLSAEVVDRGTDTATLRIDGTEIENVYTDLDQLDEGQVTLGVRPESVEITSDGDGLRGEILLIERIGDRLLVTIEGSQGEIRATTSVNQPFSEGEEVSIQFDRRSTHLFDAEAGTHLASGPDV